MLRAVRAAVGDDVAVIAKLNMVDGYRRGLSLDDSVAAARLLESDGPVDAIELTGGSSLRNPMFLFRGEAPVHELAAAFPRPMRTAIRLTGKRFLRSYPFSEAYFLPYARQFREALDLPLILLGGITRLETVQAALDGGFAFVAMARSLLRDADLVRRWAGGDKTPSPCDHRNKCMSTIYGGTHCVLVDPEHRPGH